MPGCTMGMILPVLGWRTSVAATIFPLGNITSRVWAWSNVWYWGSSSWYKASDSWPRHPGPVPVLLVESDPVSVLAASVVSYCQEGGGEGQGAGSKNLSFSQNPLDCGSQWRTGQEDKRDWSSWAWLKREGGTSSWTTITGFFSPDPPPCNSWPFSLGQ